MPGPAIFGLRFGSNSTVQPTSDELQAFMDGEEGNNGSKRSIDELRAFGLLIDQVEEFEAHGRQGSRTDLRNLMVFGVLSHTRFASKTLRTVMEQYLYHCSGLASLDLKKPAAFVRSAEEEITRLTKRKEDQVKISRLRELLDKRSKDLKDLNQRWKDQASELEHILAYLRENLDMIRALCESSIGILVEFKVGGEQESRVIEDVKTLFKEKVRDLLQAGPLTKEYLENLKADVAELTQQISKQLLEDVYAMTAVYEAVHERMKTTVDAIDGLLKEVGKKKGLNLDQDLVLFGRGRTMLADLVDDFTLDRFTLRARDGKPLSSEYEEVLEDKRAEMIRHLLELVRKNGGR